MGIGTRDISRIDDPRVLKALNDLVRATQGLADPLDARQAARELAFGTRTSTNYFSRFYYGTFRMAVMFPLFIAPKPTYLIHICPFVWGGNVCHLGVLPVGSPNFSSMTPRLIETAPNTGSVSESPKCLLWNTNASSSTLQPIFDGHPVLIDKGEALYLYNNSGSNMTINARADFMYA